MATLLRQCHPLSGESSPLPERDGSIVVRNMGVCGWTRGGLTRYRTGWAVSGQSFHVVPHGDLRGRAAWFPVHDGSDRELVLEVEPWAEEVLERGAPLARLVPVTTGQTCGRRS